MVVEYLYRCELCDGLNILEECTVKTYWLTILVFLCQKQVLFDEPMSIMFDEPMVIDQPSIGSEYINGLLKIWFFFWHFMIFIVIHKWFQKFKFIFIRVFFKLKVLSYRKKQEEFNFEGWLRTIWK